MCIPTFKNLTLRESSTFSTTISRVRLLPRIPPAKHYHLIILTTYLNKNHVWFLNLLNRYSYIIEFKYYLSQSFQTLITSRIFVINFIWQHRWCLCDKAGGEMVFLYYEICYRKINMRIK